MRNGGTLQLFREGPWTAVVSPILCGIISALVQLFYAMRIWALKRTAAPRVLAGLIGMLALTQSLTAIVACSLLQTDLSQEHLIRLRPLFSMWLSGSFANDILIAASMIWILQTAKSPTTAYISDTNSLLNRLILNTIRTGTITVLGAGVSLALFVQFTDRNYYFAITYILGKLYSNSFMATLNSRVPRTHASPSDSIRMRIQVSRETEIAQEGVKFAPPGKKDWQMSAQFNAEDVPIQKDTSSTAASIGFGRNEECT